MLPLREAIEDEFPHVDFARAAGQLTACDRRGQIYEGMAALRQVAQYLPESSSASLGSMSCPASGR